MALSKEQQAKVEKEVKKNIKRIKQFIRRAAKRGYSLPSAEDIIGKMPKKIGEGTLRKLQNITPERLYKKAVYVSPEGTKIKGTERRKQERSESAKRAAETRKSFYSNREYDYNYSTVTTSLDSEEEYSPQFSSLAIQEIQNMIATFEPSSAWSEGLTDYKNKDVKLLSNALDYAINTYGFEQTALMCEQHADELISIANAVMYQSSGDSYRRSGREVAQQNIQRFVAILKGKPLNIRESLELTSYGETYGRTLDDVEL